MSIYTEKNLLPRKYDISPKYYVYMYLREKDSKNGCKGSPYYIGKGHGNRAYDAHVRKNNTNITPKDITKIVFIDENITEEIAYMLEEYWINYFGRIDLGTGCLHNLTNGGEGGNGVKQRIETIMKRINSVKNNKHKRRKYRTNLSELARKNRSLGQKKRHTEGSGFSIEMRKKISLSNTGKIPTQLTREKISQKNKGKTAWNKNIRGTAGNTSCYFISPNNEVFEFLSLRHGCDKLKLSLKYACYVATGRRNNVNGWIAIKAKDWCLLNI